MRTLTKYAVVAVLAVSTSAHAVELEYANVLHAYMHLDKKFDYEEMVDSYMETFRPEIYRRYKDDEFEGPAKRKETIELMKKDAAEPWLEAEFTVRTHAEFGEYDFKRQAFDFHPLSEGTYFPVHHCCNQLPGQLDVYLSNTGIIDGIPMPKDEAKQFLETMKSSWGLSREVTLEFRFKLIGLKGRNALLAKITSAQVIAGRTKPRVLATYRA